MAEYRPRRSRFPLRPLIVLVVVALIAYWAYGHFTAKPPAAPTPPPAAVGVQEVQVTDLPLVFDYSARLTGSREVEIRPRVSGVIDKRFYEEGSFVKRGDTLFQIDPRPYYAALAQAKATYGQAERDWGRARKLMAGKALSQREYDTAQALYGESKAQVETAEINLAYTTVRSPISGFTSEEGFSEGNVVVADSSVLTRVTQLDPIYVEFSYPDADAMLQRRSVADGSMLLPDDKMLNVQIVFTDGTTYPTEAKIRFTDSFVDPVTGTVKARAVVNNADSSIIPGQFVRARVKGLTARQVTAVPEKALMQGPMGMFVYTVNAENKAVITPVELGLLNQGQQIVTKGLQPGDRVIVEGMIKARPDAPVCVETPEQPCGQTPPAAEGDAPKAPAEEKPAAAKE
jgi:membrane fusion protein (multidrug efflux system)